MSDNRGGKREGAGRKAESKNKVTVAREAIAEVLGKRVGAVKALQRRAFRTLAKNLEQGAAPL